MRWIGRVLWTGCILVSIGVFDRSAPGWSTGHRGLPDHVADRSERLTLALANEILKVSGDQVELASSAKRFDIGNDREQGMLSQNLF